MSEDINKKGRKFYIVPQTDEEIERNRKMIEKMRKEGLLEKHEKTFRIQKDGTVNEVDEADKSKS